jgi:cytidylate kinase
MALITISECLGCEGAAIAHGIAETLEIELFDDIRLRDTALQMGLHSEQLKGLDEKAPGFLDRIYDRRPTVYLDLMQAVVYEVAHRGEAVIIGHGSQVLLHDFDCAFHVFLCLPEPARIDGLMKQMNISSEAAQKLIHKSDNQKRRFFQFAFHKNWFDPSLYDLCLNLQKMRKEDAIQAIISMARTSAQQACSLNALDAMKRLAQAKRVEAALLENEAFPGMVSVDIPARGVAHITGAVFSHEDRMRISDIIRDIPEISEIRLDVAVISSGP